MTGPADVGQVAELETRRQQNEQAGNQQHAQHFFKFDNVANDSVPLVGHDDSHHRNGEQPGFVMQMVRHGHDEHRDDRALGLPASMDRTRAVWQSA